VINSLNVSERVLYTEFFFCVAHAKALSKTQMFQLHTLLASHGTFTCCVVGCLSAATQALCVELALLTDLGGRGEHLAYVPSFVCSLSTQSESRATHESLREGTTGSEREDDVKF
jgi:hypothetical protein